MPCAVALPDSLSFPPLIPAHAGIQSRKPRTRSPWTPASAGVSGGGGLGEFSPPRVIPENAQRLSGSPFRAAAPP